MDSDGSSEVGVTSPCNAQPRGLKTLPWIARERRRKFTDSPFVYFLISRSRVRAASPPRCLLSLSAYVKFVPVCSRSSFEAQQGLSQLNLISRDENGAACVAMDGYGKTIADDVGSTVRLAFVNAIVH